jgi:hypothetical protein
MDVRVTAAKIEAFACRAENPETESTVCCWPINSGANALRDGLELIVPS